MNDNQKVTFLLKAIKTSYNGLSRPIYAVYMPERLQDAVFQVERSSMPDTDKATLLKGAIEGCFFHPQHHPPESLQKALDTAFADEFDKRELMRKREREFVEGQRRFYGKEEFPSRTYKSWERLPDKD